MISERTKKCRTLTIVFTILHILCLIGPFLYFVPYAFITGEVVSKLTISFASLFSLLLGAISFMVDIKHRAGLHRSMLWTMIAGVLCGLTAVRPFIWIMASFSLLDELVFLPLKDKYKAATLANKEIDKRTKTA